MKFATMFFGLTILLLAIYMDSASAGSKFTHLFNTLNKLL